MNKDEERKSDIKRLKLLAKSIRFNHDKGEGGSFNAIVNPDKEIEHYEMGATQLTLPQRFGMYKTPTKDVPKFTDIKLEDPSSTLDSTSSSILEKNPNHKVRGIFD